MQLQLDHFIEEDKKKSRQIELLKKLREETLAMQAEDTRKVMFDSRNLKDNVENMKTEIYHLKKQLSEAEKYKDMYEQIKAREDERNTLDIKQKAA